MSRTVAAATRTISQGSSTFYLKTPEQGDNHGEDTLVLLWGSIGMRPTVLSKYCDTHLRRGYSVLYIPSGLKDPLLPQQVHLLSADLTAFLMSSGSHFQKIVIHAMSFGAIKYTAFMHKTSPAIRHRISAIILDSPGFLSSAEAMYKVFAAIVASSRPGQWLVYHLARLYYGVLNQDALKEFNYYSRKAKDEPLPRPTLVLTSKNDPMVDWEYVRDIFQKLSVTVPVKSRCWDRSGHCAHLFFHREEYLELFEDFLDAFIGKTMNERNLRAKM